MITRLFLAVGELIVSGLAALLPDAPELPTIEVPWPAWLPWGPVELSLGLIVFAGAAILALRIARWLYSLIPAVG